MEKILIIVDMQKDFVDGSLGTKEAQAIVPAVKEKIENFNGDIIFTKDTHGEECSLQVVQQAAVLLPFTHKKILMCGKTAVPVLSWQQAEQKMMYAM